MKCCKHSGYINIAKIGHCCITTLKIRSSSRRYLMKKLLLLLCLFFLACATVRAEMPADLAKAIKDYDQAQFHNDVITLDDLVTDDFVLVNSDSSLQNKKEFLDDFKRPGFSLEPYMLQQKVEK